MKLSREQRFILFSLGICYVEANKRLRDRAVQVSLSKKAFIDFVMGSGLAKKTERALYRNLEGLEERKFVSYRGKYLALTDKGQRVFSVINREITPYINVFGVIGKEEFFKHMKKARTILAQEESVKNY